MKRWLFSGKRIRPSDKDLVFHTAISILLPVFILVVALFHAKTILEINRQEFHCIKKTTRWSRGSKELKR